MVTPLLGHLGLDPLARESAGHEDDPAVRRPGEGVAPGHHRADAELEDGGHGQRVRAPEPGRS